jgi:hypothetical protein
MASGLRTQKPSVKDVSVKNRLKKTNRTAEMRHAILITNNYLEDTTAFIQ